MYSSNAMSNLLLFFLLWHLLVGAYNCFVVVMHRYEILPIIQLADIAFHLLADTDNQSDYKFLHASCNFSIYFLKFC